MNKKLFPIFIFVATIVIGIVSVILFMNPQPKESHTESCPYGNSPPCLFTNLATGRFPRDVSVNSATNKTYVASEFGLYVIDDKNNLNKIDSGFSNATGLIPVDLIAVNEITNKIYSVTVSDGIVSTINGYNNKIESTTEPLGNIPYEIMVNGMTNKIYLLGIPDLHVINETTGSISKVKNVWVPLRIAINPNTNKVYVVNNGRVSVINGINDAVLKEVNYEIGNLGFIAVNNATNKIYVGDDNNKLIVVIDGSNDTVKNRIKLPDYPQGIVVNSKTGLIYVSDGISKHVSIINGTTDTITSDIILESPSMDGVVNPITNKIYFMTQEPASSVSVIDGATNTLQSIINLDDQPNSIAINTVTNKIYVTNGNMTSIILGAR
jgi:DNA-binding beta-propeller fold protein YncE